MFICGKTLATRPFFLGCCGAGTCVFEEWELYPSAKRGFPPSTCPRLTVKLTFLVCASHKDTGGWEGIT